MTISKVNIIIPPLWSEVYYNTARLLMHALEDNGITEKISKPHEAGNENLSVVVGWNINSAEKACFFRILMRSTRLAIFSASSFATG